MEEATSEFVCAITADCFFRSSMILELFSFSSPDCFATCTIFSERSSVVPMES